MPPLSTLARGIPRSIRERGDEYYRLGRVRVTHIDDFSARATVQGSGRYDVSVYWDDQGITDADCDCPYAEDHFGVCEHIWATAIAARAEVTGGAAPGRGGSSRPGTRGAAAGWRAQLARVRQRMEEDAHNPAVPARVSWPAERRVVYVLDLPETYYSVRGGLVLDLTTERLDKNGHWSAPKKSNYPRHQWLAVPDAADRLAIQMLFGTSDPWGFYGSGNATRFLLAPDHYETILRTVCQTGHCRVRRDPADDRPAPIAWDDGPPWEFRLRVAREGSGGNLELTGHLARDGEEMPLSEPVVLLRTGLVFVREKVARLNDFGAFELIATLRAEPKVTVPAGDAWTLIEDLYRLPHPPKVELPDDLRVEEVEVRPVPTLKVRQAPHAAGGTDRLAGDLTFDYAGTHVMAGSKGDTMFDPGARRALRRDRDGEAEAWQLLERVGFRPEYDLRARTQGPMIAFNRFPRAVRELVAAGWHVEADGRLYRRAAGEPTVAISSGIDWFDLDARVDFGGTGAPLPRLLAALKKGESTVTLDDGSVGVLPEDWLKKYAPLAGFGEEQPDGRLRFRSTQAAFLDALLASTPQATWDESFNRLRTRLHTFDGISAAEAPDGFKGELRPYQKEGLGWLHFLRDFSFGGCLADDMGLGKTIQVLALLQARRGHGPSLVVAPRSLIFNWIEEARRFTPGIKVLDHSAGTRKRSAEVIGEHDLVLTTYGTLRRDAGFLKDVRFHYAILDEAQAVKNASTASAKAVRLLNADHRLALSGTPIENHLGELWSLLDFLNPGMLGTSAAFRQFAGSTTAPDAPARAALARAVRPFLLRRTKDQVAKDLPERTEQTIHCELEPEQRKLYNELRDHYRQALLGKIDETNLSKAKFEILEGLLRLRQAACHPALLDPKHAKSPSAKLDALLGQLEEILEENHKALVFSQFTSLLALVKERLDAKQIRYEYLDGQTRDRQERVAHFQSDPACKVFLISLKAGGVGLNLTAADYVFLLDPWWNPAAEAQAIDRTHRIGQTRPVLAYRLIAKDTVEEKVLALQQSKRALADAILTADNAVLSKLTREDLDLLLS